MSIGERVREIRTDYGFTQVQLSNAIFVSRALIGNIESGKANVTRRFIKNFCEEFKVNEEWLLTGNGEKYTDKSKYIVNPDLKLPVDDAWNTSTGCIFKYALIADRLAESCNLDTAIWTVFNNMNFVEIMNFIISSFILPGIRDIQREREFFQRFNMAFPEFDKFCDYEKLGKIKQKNLMEMKSNETWKDIDNLTFAVFDDPTVLGIPESAMREEKALSHRVYVKK